MSKLIFSKVESFLGDEVKYEVTDPDYLGNGPKVIATFIDPADAQNFIAWSTADHEKFMAGVREASEKYAGVSQKLAELGD